MNDTEPSDDSIDRKLPTGAILAGIGILAVLGLLYYFRPWIQPIVYFLYATPVIPIVLVISIGVAFLISDKEMSMYASLTVFAILLVVLGSFAGMHASSNLGVQTMEDSTDTDTLIESDIDNPRVVTKGVATRYASNTLNFPQYKITDADLTVYNDSLHWSYGLTPDGVWNHFTKKQNGAVFVDVSEQNADVKTQTGLMDKGIGTAFYNNYRWATIKSGEYLVNYQDPVNIVHDGNRYIAVPYKKPNFILTPLPHTIPEWGGVALIDSDGNVEMLSPEEARNHEALEGQRLYPFDLAAEKVGTTKYRNGIVNTFTSHKDEIELAPVPGDNNDQPFMVQTPDGPVYIVAVEPYGDAQGVREIWTVDARTGEYERYETGGSLFGPRKATDYVRQAARTTDWDRFNPSEPIPVFVNDQLYWEVRVVPNDNSGISYIAFVNADNSEVHEVETTPQVKAFMAGENVSETPTSEPDNEQQPAMIVKKVSENGTVIETMEVYDNESVEIERGNQTSQSDE